MSEDTPEDLAKLKDELSNKVYTSIAHLLKIYAGTYVERFNDTLELNNTMVYTVAQMLGEMIACYPEDEQEDVVKWVIDAMASAQNKTSAQLNHGVEPEPAKLASGEYDLANMTPRGNC